MARPVLRAKKAVADAGGTSNIVVPLNSGWNTSFGDGNANYSPADNDFIIVSRVIGDAGTTPISLSVTAPSGSYTTRAELSQDDSADCNFLVATKFAVASTDTQLTLSATGDTANEGAYIVEIWSGVDTTTPMDVTPTTAGNINGGQPNPPAITPTTADTVVVVTCAAAVLTGMVAFTQPGSELSNFLSVAQTGGTEAVVGSGSFNWVSGTFDPVAWTGGSTGSGACWTAVCLALRPAAGGGSSQTLTASLFTNTNTFHSPQVNLSLLPSLFSNTNTFHSSQVNLTLLPSFFSNTNTFYNASIVSGQVLTASLFTNTNTFYNATLTSNYIITAPLFVNTNTFYSPQVNLTLLPSLFTSENIFYPSTIENRLPIKNIPFSTGLPLIKFRRKSP